MGDTRGELGDAESKLRDAVHSAYSGVALYRHFTGDDHVGTTLSWNRAAVMPLQHRGGLHQSQHGTGF